VADEKDVEALAYRRGQTYTADEVRRIVAIADPDVVAQIHRYKRTFNGAVRGR
jgi:hypothetical protein